MEQIMLRCKTSSKGESGNRRRKTAKEGATGGGDMNVDQRVKS